MAVLHPAQVRNRAKRSEKLRLLQDVSALFHPASMAAIMGPSGSGAPVLADRESPAACSLHALTMSEASSGSSRVSDGAPLPVQGRQRCWTSLPAARRRASRRARSCLLARRRRRRF